MMKYVLLTALFVSTIVIAADKIEDKTILAKDTDADMNVAIEEARSTLDQFLSLVSNPPKDASDFKVKVKVSDTNGTEHLWVTPFKYDGKRFAGIVANEPTYVRSVTFGEPIRFTRDQITDWGYTINGKQKGSFTVCALFKRMPSEEVKRYREDYGFEC